MADSVGAVDVRRPVGWLPGDQDELEAWLAGHRERVAAKKLGTANRTV
jgi:phosphatidylserine decarboxylase